MSVTVLIFLLKFLDFYYCSTFNNFILFFSIFYLNLFYRSVAGHPLLDIMINNITDSNTSKKANTKENTKTNQACLLPGKNTNAIFQNLTNSDFFSSFFTEDENLKISEAKGKKIFFIFEYLCKA